jgi:hypothetical protein
MFKPLFVPTYIPAEHVAKRLSLIVEGTTAGMWVENNCTRWCTRSNNFHLYDDGDGQYRIFTRYWDEAAEKALRIVMINALMVQMENQDAGLIP